MRRLVSSSSGYKPELGSYVHNSEFSLPHKVQTGSVSDTVTVHTTTVGVLHWELIRPINLTVLAKSNRRVPNLPWQEFTAFIVTASFTVKSASENTCKSVEVCKINCFISILGHQLLFAHCGADNLNTISYYAAAGNINWAHEKFQLLEIQHVVQ